MKFRILALAVVFCCRMASAQELHPEMMQPGRTLQTNAEPKHYADSAAFDSLFKKFYPDVKPAMSVHQSAEQTFKQISRTFAMQGIDSAEAAKAAFKGLDEKAFYKIYYDIFRRNLSAKELKKYAEFIRTPEGTHIAEVWSSLQSALPQANMYVARTVNSNLTPLRQAAREKMEKEHPPSANPQLAPPMMGMPPMNNPAAMDSLMKARNQMVLQHQMPRRDSTVKQ